MGLHSSELLRLMCMQLSLDPQSSTHSLPLFPPIIPSLSQLPPNASSPRLGPRPLLLAAASPSLVRVQFPAAIFDFSFLCSRYPQLNVYSPFHFLLVWSPLAYLLTSIRYIHWHVCKKKKIWKKKYNVKWLINVIIVIFSLSFTPFSCIVASVPCHTHPPAAYYYYWSLTIFSPFIFRASFAAGFGWLWLIGSKMMRVERQGIKRVEGRGRVRENVGNKEK